MFTYKTKMDYTKKHTRADVHTSIRDDLYKKLLILSIEHKQPASKMFDVLLMELFQNKDNINDFIMKTKSY